MCVLLCICSAGKLRWNLQKKLESDPSCSVLLIQVLVKELENCHKAAQRRNSEADTDKVATGQIKFVFRAEGCERLRVQSRRDPERFGAVQESSAVGTRQSRTQETGFSGNRSRFNSEYVALLLDFKVKFKISYRF